MKPTCILHVGMPKTGTTSIQVSLARGLRNPAFPYLHPGHSQSGMFLESLFSSHPEDYWQFQLRRYSSIRLRWMRWANTRRFQGILEQARDGSQTPILSSERWWIVPSSDLEGLRDFLERYGFRAHVVVYIRPLKSWIESCFQEEAKWHGLPPDCFPQVWNTRETQFHRCVERLAEYERVFGRENLTVRPFVRAALKDGCVVRDFCDLLGIPLEPDHIARSNESISLDAVKFLHAYDRFDSGRKVPPLYVPSRWALVKCLEGLQGTPFRFHSEAIAPIRETLASENQAMAERYDIDLAENVHAADGGPCIREGADMERFSEDALEWLAEASDTKPIEVREGEAAAREVANRIERLRRRLIWRRRRTYVSRKINTLRSRTSPRT